MIVAYFNDHFFHRVPLGLARYGRELFEALRSDRSLEVCPVGVWSNLDRIGLEELCARTGGRVLPGGRPRWALRWLIANRPRLEHAFQDFDVLHITAPGYPVATARPTVVTIHDIGLVTHPEFFSTQHPWLFRAHLRDIVRRQAQVICVSRHTAEELRRHVACERLRIEIVHEGVADVFTREPDENTLRRVRARVPRPFFLSAGSMNPRKNLARLCRAFAGLVDRIPHDLVLVGSRGWDDGDVWEAFQQPGLRERIRFLGFVTDEELAALYRLADGYAFVSLFEGFGLPAVEAMGAGCPVVAASCTSLPELVKDAGLLVDPLDVQAIAVALRRLADDAALRRELAARGRARASCFSWAEAARLTREVYAEAVRTC